MKTVNVSNFKSDKYYPKIQKAVKEILGDSNVVRPVEVFVKLDILTEDSLKDWYNGKVPYLEKVVQCNLSKASRILRILRMHAHDLNLNPSTTAYIKKGKGRKIPLRFSKTGDGHVEEAYSRHFIRKSSKREAEVIAQED